VKRLTLVALLVASCAKPPAAPPTDTNAACRRAVVILRADRANHVACSMAQAHARGAEPTCPLDFTCHDVPDAGAP